MGPRRHNPLMQQNDQRLVEHEPGALPGEHADRS
jgi:hypothetical protein